MCGPQMRMRVNFFLIGFESPVGHPVVKQRDEKHREKSGREHATGHASAYGMPRARACAA